MCRWEDNTRMDLEEICINTRNWVDSAQDRDYWRALVNAALNLRAPYAMELVIIVEIFIILRSKIIIFNTQNYWITMALNMLIDEASLEADGSYKIPRNRYSDIDISSWAIVSFLSWSTRLLPAKSQT